MSTLGDRLAELLRTRVLVDPVPHPTLFTPCWHFIGESNRNGYKRVCIGGKRPVAHRVVFEALVGAIPAGMLLDHLCRNRGCCAPYHLEAVTPRTNTLRGMAQLFKPRGFYDHLCQDHR